MMKKTSKKTKAIVGGVIFVLVFALVLLPELAERVNAADRMYWTDASARKIQRANLDGSGVEDLIVTGNAPIGIALDVAGGKMYWVEADSQKIRRANLDGSAVEDLVGSVGPVGIALDVTGSKMYWTDVFVTGKIQRANLDGSGVQDLVSVIAMRGGIALDVVGGKMYWTNGSHNWVQRANLDGSGVENLVVTLDAPTGIALDVAAGKMYWTEAHTLRRANLDGSGVEDLCTGFDRAFIALDLTGGKIYWTLGDRIRRANLDGSAGEDLVTGLFIAAGIALKLEQPRLGGSVTSMSPTRGVAICQNVTTKELVWIDLPKGAKSWDCEQAGLVVNQGDFIRMWMLVQGLAD